MPGRSPDPIPAFLNPLSSNAAVAPAALRATGRFDVRQVVPAALGLHVRRVVAAGASRILIAGGDGTVGTAAAGLFGTTVELAILPCGMRNHFARDLGIPIDPAAALRVALEGRVVPADAATVDGRVFVNTSAVGAYVRFVRTRDRLEPGIGYRLASLAAALRLFIRLPLVRATVELREQERERDPGWTPERRRRYITPLVFIGVNERDLRMPAIGARVPGGRRGLHVMIVHRRSGARALALALEAAARGVRAVSGTPAMDAFLVNSLRVDPRSTTIALDGELVRAASPLEYRHMPDALRVVVP